MPVHHAPSERNNKNQKGTSTSAAGGQQQAAGVVQPTDAHAHTGYPNYAGSYGVRDAAGWSQYQPGWGPGPMMYAQTSPVGLAGPAGGFNQNPGRGQSGAGNNSVGSGGYAGSQYVGGNRSGGNTGTTGSNTSGSGGAPASNLQSTNFGY